MKTVSRTWTVVPLALLLLSCKPAGEEEGAAPVAPTRFPLPASALSVAEQRNVRPSFEFPAVVEAIQTADYRAQISAVIETIHFTPGQMVTEGDLMIEFDRADFETNLAIAGAQLQTARAAAEQAAANWSRAQELQPDGFISAQDFDTAKAAFDSTQADVARAEAAVKQAELDLSRTAIYAPFSGKVSRPNYSVGTFVQPGNPTQPLPLFSLAQLDPIYVTGDVELGVYNRAVLARRRMADEGRPIPELELRLELAGGGTYEHIGSFESWDSSTTSTRGTIKGRVNFPNPEGLLLPGENVLILGEYVEAVEAIVVPQRAVQLDQQGHFVLIVNAEDSVERRNIEVGIRIGADWSVVDGLQTGDRVVVDGVQMLRVGTAVDIQTDD